MSTAYDKAKWHYGGDYPADLPPENGATHIGVFLAWAFNRHLEGELHHDRERDEQALEAVRDRTMTGREFLIRQCDESLIDEDLSEEGNQFAAWYYEANIEGRSHYFNDYAAVLCEPQHDTLYHVEDTWSNYDKMAAVIDRRFGEWKQATGSIP
jgi:hypothetical protein